MKANVEEHRHFPLRHTTLNNKIRHVRKKINVGTLECWKLKMLTENTDMKAMDKIRRKSKTVSWITLLGARNYARKA